MATFYTRSSHILAAVLLLYGFFPEFQLHSDCVMVGLRLHSDLRSSRANPLTELSLKSGFVLAVFCLHSCCILAVYWHQPCCILVGFLKSSCILAAFSLILVAFRFMAACCRQPHLPRRLPQAAASAATWAAIPKGAKQVHSGCLLSAFVRSACVMCGF